MAAHRHPAAGSGEPAQPRLPAGHGRADRAARERPVRQFLDLAQVDVPVSRSPDAGTRRGDHRLRADGNAGSRLCRGGRVPLPAPPARRHTIWRPRRAFGRISAAAAASGIGLTLLPVLYEHGGCDGRALGPGQIRFGNDPDRFGKLWEGAKASLRHLAVRQTSALRRIRCAQSANRD
jgi:hypothetical protein